MVEELSTNADQVMCIQTISERNEFAKGFAYQMGSITRMIPNFEQAYLEFIEHFWKDNTQDAYIDQFHRIKYYQHPPKDGNTESVLIYEKSGDSNKRI